MEPAAIPETPAIARKLVRPAAATPINKEALDTRPSFAPRTAARNHPDLLPRWC